MMPDQTSHADLLALTTEIVSSHVSNNSVTQNDLAALIEQVFRTLSGLGSGVSTISAERIRIVLMALRSSSWKG